MKIDLFQIDAFTSQVFKGNPAAVCPLTEWLPDDLLLNIAIENNLAETAFFVPMEDGTHHLRWFTPEIEMDLCGHATLASAFVLFQFLDYSKEVVSFETKSGRLEVKQVGNYLEMDLPSRPPKMTDLPKVISEALSKQPNEIWKSRDYMLVYDTEEDIARLEVNAQTLERINLDPGGIIVTAAGNEVDFVSRFFTPGAAIFEDPVTGSAHCTLTPYWADRLGKKEFMAHQISARGGELRCTLHNERILIQGQAVCYLKGTIEL